MVESLVPWDVCGRLAGPLYFLCQDGLQVVCGTSAVALVKKSSASRTEIYHDTLFLTDLYLHWKSTSLVFIAPPVIEQI